MEKVPVECSKCKAEREHSIIIKENTGSNVVVTARCLTCGQTITLPIAEPGSHGRPLAEYLKGAIPYGNYRRKIRKG